MKRYQEFPGPFRRFWDNIAIGTECVVSGLKVRWDWVFVPEDPPVVDPIYGERGDLMPGWVLASGESDDLSSVSLAQPFGFS